MQQGCQGQTQKVAEAGNRNNGVFPVNTSWIFQISSFVLMLLPKWWRRQKRCQLCSAIRAVGGAAFPGVPDLPSTGGEMNTHYHLPATGSCHLTWLSGGKGPRVSPPALPFSAQAGPEGLTDPSPKSPGLCWGFFSTLSAPSHRENLRKVAVPLSTELLLGRRKNKTKGLDRDFRKTWVCSLFCFWNPQCISRERCQHSHCQQANKFQKSCSNALKLSL